MAYRPSSLLVLTAAPGPAGQLVLVRVAAAGLAVPSRLMVGEARVAGGLAAPAALRIAGALALPSALSVGEARAAGGLAVPSALRLAVALTAPSVAVNTVAARFSARSTLRTGEAGLAAGAALRSALLAGEVRVAGGLVAPAALRLMGELAAPSAGLTPVRAGLAAPSAGNLGLRCGQALASALRVGDPLAGGLTVPSALRLAVELAAPSDAMAPVRTGLAVASAAMAVVRGVLVVPSAPMGLVVVGLAAPSDAAAAVRAGLAAVSGAMASVRAGLVGPSAGLTPVRAGLAVPSIGRSTVVQALAAGSALRPTDPVRVGWSAWSVLRGEESAVSRLAVTLYHQGRALPITSADLRCDDGSPTWTADVGLAQLDDFATVALGDAVLLSVECWSIDPDGAETLADSEMWDLRVDGRRLDRSAPGAQQQTITAVSPLVLRGSPWAPPLTRSWPAAVPARDAVEALIGAVEWRLVEWVIPLGKLAAERADPVQLARQVVAAAGGVLESRPDGTVVARPAYPVSPPDWATAPTDLALADDRLVSVSETLDPVDVVNRITITSGTTTEASDTLVWVADDGDEHTGTLRLYPNPWRDLVVVHTGDAGVTLTRIGEVVEVVTETLELRAGRASPTRPVDRVTGVTWLSRDLGGLDVGGSATDLVAGAADWSLASVTYETRRIDHRAADLRRRDVQFLAMEA